MMLSLKGKLTEVDSYNRLIFRDIDDESIDKLARHCNGEHKPYTRYSVTVKLPKKWKTVPQDLMNFVGLRCNIVVKVKSYKFKSKSMHNLNEEISGHTLILLDINRGN